jgi:predicted NAD-dependent protein-ADP-ribosyltransferase YbiA (DUF1768 family)
MIPGKQKQLGESFCEKTMREEVTAVTSFKCNLLTCELQQIAYLHEVLKSTGEKILMKANPHDSF